MDALLTSLNLLIVAMAKLLGALGVLLIPVIPLAIWIAFWLFAVNWAKLRSALLSGGMIGLFLIGLVAVIVWGAVAPPAEGVHNFLGLKLSNLVGKTVLVTGLACIMLLCGSVQLSGFCANWCQFEDDSAEGELHAAIHGHGDGHGGHHDDHGHGHH
jgi:hypothetical protein